MKELDDPDRPRTFWAPDCAGLDYVEACNLGAMFALEAVQFMRASRMSPVLGWSVIDMPPYEVASDAEKGVMIGFLQTIAQLAMDAATPGRLAHYERRHTEWVALWAQLCEEQRRRDERNRRRRERRAGRA